MDWTGALTDDWSYGFDHDWTQSDWYDGLTGMTMVGMTTGPGVVEVTLLDLQHCPNLSNQLHPAALPRTQLVSLGAQDGTAPPPNVSALHSTVNVTDLETGETLTHSPSRRTGTVTRPVRTGTGLLSAFLSVVAVMNSLGKPQGLPLILKLFHLLESLPLMNMMTC